MSAPKDPDKVLKEAVEKTIDVVADYVEPGPRNAEATMEKVIETVDNDEVKAAIEAFDEKRETATAIADQEHRDDGKAKRKER